MCVCVLDNVRDAVFSVECLSVVRLLLLSADATSLSAVGVPSEAVTGSASLLPCSASSAGLMTRDMVYRCLLPVADVLLSAGTHVYLSTARLHRAMSMMVALTTLLNTSQGLKNYSSIFHRCCIWLTSRHLREEQLLFLLLREPRVGSGYPLSPFSFLSIHFFIFFFFYLFLFSFALPIFFILFF